MYPLLHHELCLVGLLVFIMLFAYWFAYCVGSPMADAMHVDASAILFFIPYSLAKRRMRGNLFDQAVEAWRQELSFSHDTIGAVQALRNHRHNLVVQGRELFGWERSLLCPVCLHWWLSLIAGADWLLITHGSSAAVDLAVGSLTYLSLHLFIRKI